MKTNCPTIEDVRKLNGLGNPELDAREGIDKRLMKIKLEREEFLTRQKLLNRIKKMKKICSSFSFSYRPVLAKDIYYTEKDNYFFSYVLLECGDLYPRTEFFKTYKNALERLIEVQELQSEE